MPDVQHTITLTDEELSDLYGFLKNAEYDFYPGVQAVWERAFDLWFANRERIIASSHFAASAEVES